MEILGFLEFCVMQTPRPKKYICVFTVTWQKNLGSVSIIFKKKKTIGKTGNSRFRNPIPVFSFSKFPASRHLLKLFNDELHSFSTFFALNFDKKLAEMQLVCGNDHGQLGMTFTS